MTNLLEQNLQLHGLGKEMQALVDVDKRPLILVQSLLNNVLDPLPLQAVHVQAARVLSVLGQEADGEDAPGSLEVVIEQSELHLELILDHELDAAPLNLEAFELVGQLGQGQATLDGSIQIREGCF